MKLFYASIEDIPKDLVSYYIERDGDKGKGFYLVIEGGEVPTAPAAGAGSGAPDPNIARLEAELAESRANLTTKDNELRAAKGELGRIDKAKYDELMAKERQAAASNTVTITQAEIDTQIEARTTTMAEDHRRQIEEKDRLIESLQGDVTKTRQHLGEFSIDQALLAAVGRIGMTLRPGAQEDFMTRGRRAWSIDENSKPVPKGPNETQIRYGKNAEPETMDEWVRKLATEGAKHLFASSKGGGGNPSDAQTDPMDGVRFCSQADIDAGRVDISEVASGKYKLRTS